MSDDLRRKVRNGLDSLTHSQIGARSGATAAALTDVEKAAVEAIAVDLNITTSEVIRNAVKVYLSAYWTFLDHNRR